MILGEINSLLSLLNVAITHGCRVNVCDLPDLENCRSDLCNAKMLIIDLGRVSRRGDSLVAERYGCEIPVAPHPRVFIYSYWHFTDDQRRAHFPCRSLVPWNYQGHHDWIGWGYDPPPPPSETTPRRYGVLWQKNPRVFLDTTSPFSKVLHRVLEAFQYHRVPLKITAEVPESSIRSRYWKPGLVERMGVLQYQQWHELLRGAAFVVGIGVPVLGPTVTDALFNGCVLMCSKQQVPESLLGNRNLRCLFDRERLTHDPHSLERWIRGHNGVERTALRLIRGEERFDVSDVPDEFLRANHEKRCLRLIESVFDQGPE